MNDLWMCCWQKHKRTDGLWWSRWFFNSSSNVKTLICQLHNLRLGLSYTFLDPTDYFLEYSWLHYIIPQMILGNPDHCNLPSTFSVIDEKFNQPTRISMKLIKNSKHSVRALLTIQSGKHLGSGKFGSELYYPSKIFWRVKRIYAKESSAVRNHVDEEAKLYSLPVV